MMMIVDGRSAGSGPRTGFFFELAEEPLPGKLILFAQLLFDTWPPPELREPAPELPDRPDPELPPERLELPEPDPLPLFAPRTMSQHKAAATTTVAKMTQPFFAAFRCAWLCVNR